MDTLDRILKIWSEGQDVETLIAQDLFSEQAAIQADLDKLPDPQKDAALSVLNDIQSALQTYIVNVDTEAKAIKAQIDNTLRSKNACLSYGSSIDIEKRGKKDDL